MRIAAVPAPGREVAAPDHEVVRSCDPAIFTRRTGFEVPDVVAPKRGADPDRPGVLKSGDEDPGCPAGGADHLRLRGDRFYDLVGILPAVVAAGGVPGEDESLVHA